MKTVTVSAVVKKRVSVAMANATRAHKLKVILMGLVCTTGLYSHPVIYKGGIAIMSVVRPQMSRFEANYSILRNMAVGVTYRRFQLSDREIEAVFPQVNLLAKRWNLKSSQANIYLMGGVGYAEDSLGRDGLAYYTAIQADWEDRRYYQAIKAEMLKAPDEMATLFRYRAGLAPYKSKFNELQVWFMAQVDYVPQMQNQTTITPLMRFFYKSALWEIGSTLKGNWFLQLMIHF